MSKHLAIFVIFTSLVLAYFFNYSNLSYIRNTNQKNITINSKSLVNNASIYSIDNNWYLPQAYNLNRGNGLTIETGNPYSYVRRTPGYSLFFYAHLKLFGDKAYSVIRYTQVILFVVSVMLLTMAVQLLFGKRLISIFSGLIYSTSLNHSGWLFYTITEGIHPQMLAISFYFLIRYAQKKQLLWLFLTGLGLAITVLIRPLNGIVVPFVFLYVWLEYDMSFNKKLIKSLTALGLGFLLFIVPWTIRNYIVTGGDIILLEKYYQGDPMNMGKGHVAFRAWWSCWGISDSERAFHDMVAQSKTDSLMQGWTNQFIAQLPQIAFRGYSEKELSDALHTLMLCHREKIASNRGFQFPHPDLPVLACDEVAKQKFDNLIHKYKKADPFRYWVITPITFAKEFIFQSNSSAWAMLNPEGRNFNVWQKVVKGWMYILNVLLFASLLVIPFIPLRNNNIKWILIGFPLTTLLFLTVFFRHIESRYMLQTYFCMMISLAISFHYLLPLSMLENLYLRLRKGLSKK